MDEHEFHYHRRIVNEIRLDGIIPKLPFETPELRALDQERKRLVNELEDAEGSGGVYFDRAHHTAERAKALKEGKEPPPEPPSPADRQEALERRQRNIDAARNALIALGDEICRTVANHPEWKDMAQAHVEQAQRAANEAMQAAREAERRAASVGVVLTWLRHAAVGDLYPPQSEGGVEPISNSEDVVFSPEFKQMVDAIREGQPI